MACRCHHSCSIQYSVKIEVKNLVGLMCAINPLPTLLPSDGNRIYGTVASSPRAT